MTRRPDPAGTIPRHNVLLPLERNPLEVYLLGLCVLTGALNLIAPTNPHSPHLPAIVDSLWYLLLITGGLVSLTGLYWSDAITGMLLTRAGLIPTGAGAYAYAVAVAHTLHAPAVVSGIVIAAFGAAAHARAWQISRQLRLDGAPR